ncbi:MAG: cobalt ECF transporter T component CbiQ [Desulfotalea sp.]
MINEELAQGHSLLHRLDPRVKIIIAGLFALQVAITQNLNLALFYLFLSTALLILAKLPWWLVCKRLIFANTFILFIWLTLPFSYHSADTISVGSINLSLQGLKLAGLITIKANAALLSFISLLATSNAVSIGHALESLKVPSKLCYLLLFSYRYIFVIHHEYLTLLRAAKMRCFNATTSIHTYQTYAYLFAMTLVRSHNRAQCVYKAMVLRGFTGKFQPLILSKLQTKDYIFLFICLFIFLVTQAGQWFLYEYY